MFHEILLVINLQDIVDAVAKGYTWGIAALIFGTAAMMAASLIGWLIHRS